MQEGREGNSHPGAKGRAKVAMMCGMMGLLAVAGSSATLRMHSAIATRRDSLPLRSESHILENRLPSMVKRASRPFLYAEKLRNTPARWSVGKSFLGNRSQSSGASSTSTTTACRACHVTHGSADTKDRRGDFTFSRSSQNNRTSSDLQQHATSMRTRRSHAL